MFIRSPTKERYYSKSFLGDGMDRMLVHVIRQAIIDSPSKQLSNEVICPCLQSDVVLETYQDKQMVKHLRWKARTNGGNEAWNVKPLQDLEGDATIMDFMTNTNQFAKRKVKGDNAINMAAATQEHKFGVAGAEAGTTNRVANVRQDKLHKTRVAECLVLVKKIFAGQDENKPKLDYLPQFASVRQALLHSKPDGQPLTATKEVIILSHNAFSKLEFGLLKRKGDAQKILEDGTYEMKSQFGLVAPLLSAYFTYVLWSPDAYNLDAYCNPDTCAYLGGSVSWTAGASAFYAGLLHDNNAAAVVEWGKDVFDTPAEHEDADFAVCAEAKSQAQCDTINGVSPNRCTWTAPVDEELVGKCRKVGL